MGVSSAILGQPPEMKILYVSATLKAALKEELEKEGAASA